LQTEANSLEEILKNQARQKSGGGEEVGHTRGGIGEPDREDFISGQCSR